ncbi:hypothetical protein BG004_007706 [Podila humilis]|nr:hypothetical protein BG004_007706 [Podila humilis]
MSDRNPAWNGTDRGNGDGTGGGRGGWRRCGNSSDRGCWSRPIEMLSNEDSYIIATCYLAFLTLIAVAMVIRSKTRLRIFAGILTFFGLTIAVLGYLWSEQIIAGNWFWSWNFIAEGVAVVGMAFIIVSVGSGFYPMAPRKSILWKCCMVVVFLYGSFALFNVSFYIYHKIIPRPISSDELNDIRNKLLERYGDMTRHGLEVERDRAVRKGELTGTFNETALTGVPNWMQLSESEVEMFARPNTTLYLSHQMVMLFTMAVASFYLFIPLVRNHRKGPVGRPVDSDTMAVGVWYLTCLLTLAVFYLSLNLVFIYNQNFIFEQPAQALDLCVRIIVGPIFYLPAPAFMFRFYRQHFKKFRGTNSSGLNGSGGKNTDSNNTQVDSSANCASSPRAGVSHFQPNRFASSARGSFDTNHDISKVQRSDQASTLYNDKKNDYTNVGNNNNNYTSNSANPQGCIKFFQTRDRGLSVESSRVLSKDFEYEEQTSNYSEERPDSFHQYYNNMDSTHHPLRDSVTMGAKHVSGGDFGYKPPGITEVPTALVRATSKSDFLTERPAVSTLDGRHHTRSSKDTPSVNAGNTSEYETATTRTSSTTPESYSTISTKSATPATATPAALSTPLNSPTADARGNPAVPKLNELTGLQKQLAEHRADLLARVIAVKEYHEDLATPEAIELGLKPTSTAYEHDVVLKDANSLTAIHRIFDSDSPVTGLSGHAENGSLSTERSSSPTMTLRKPASSAALNMDSSSKTLKESRSKGKILSAFTKALSGDGTKNSHNHHHHSNDSSNIRPTPDFKEGDKEHTSSLELQKTSSGGASGRATVEELAEASVSSLGDQRNVDKRDQKYTYSDPYENQATFKNSLQLQNQDRKQVLRQQGLPMGPVSSSTGSYSRTECPVARAAAAAEAAKKGTVSISSASLPSLPNGTAQPIYSRKLPPVPKDSRPVATKKSGHSSSSSRSSRSKSDAAFRPSAEASRGPSTELHIASRRAPLPSAAVSATALPVPSKTSLSPPPRQSWSRTKSHKGNSPPLIPSIDTKLANDDASDGMDPASTGSATSVSLTSSSQSSPTSGSYTRETVTDESSTPPVPGFHQSNSNRGTATDNSSVNRERNGISVSSPASGANNTSPSPALSSPSPISKSGDRGMNRHQQRSIDNLGSSYYYKRAAEQNYAQPASLISNPLSNSRSKHSLTNPSQSNGMRGDGGSSIMLPSSLMSTSTTTSPPSPQLGSGAGVSYFGTRHHTHASISSISPSTSPGFSPSLSPGSKSGSGSGLGLGSSQDSYGDYHNSNNSINNSSNNSNSNGGRTGSLTKQSTILAEDPWTMALVNRAQSQAQAQAQGQGQTQVHQPRQQRQQ